MKNAATTSIDNFKSKHSFKIHLGVLHMLINMKQVIFKKDFLFEFADKVKHMCYEFIRVRCTAEDLRNVSKKDLGYFTSNLESLLDYIYPNQSDKVDQVYYYSDNLELEIALRCLQMPVLEKKLTGHNTLMIKIYHARNNGTTQQNNQSQMNQRWLTPERLVEWMDRV